MHRLLGELKEGLLFVISAPAGTGKTTLVRMLTEEFSCVIESVSYTTRAPRPKEIPGRDYHFIDKQDFEKRIAKQDFLEYATVFHHYYGTAKSSVEELRRQGKHVLLVIDTQGARQLMNQLEAVFVFISPPHLDELRNRLLSRRSETKEGIEHRLSWAQQEMAQAAHYHYHIVNDNLSIAYEVLRSILIAEEHKVRKNS